MFKLIILLLLPVFAHLQEVAINYTTLSSPRRAFSVLQADNKLYFAGGFENNDFAASDRVDVFDMDTQTWDTPLKLPSQPRAFISPILIEPNLFFVGGINYYNPLHMFSTGDRTNTVAPANEKPTVLRPIQIAAYDSTVAVVGTNSVDFFHTNNETWTSSEELTAIMSRLFGSVVFSSENFVFVLGGMNVSTRQLVDSAWVYDMTTSTVTPTPHVIAVPFNSTEAQEFQHATAFNTTAVWSRDHCFLFHAESQQWLEVDISNVITVVSIEQKTFVFNPDGFETVDWSTNAIDWTGDSVVHFAFGIDGQAGYIKVPNAASTAVVVYFNDQWTETPLTLPEASPFSPVVHQLAFPGMGFLFTDERQMLYIYELASRSINVYRSFETTQIFSLMAYSSTNFAVSTVDPSTGVDDLHIIAFPFNSQTTFTVSFRPTLGYEGLFFDFSRALALVLTSPNSPINFQISQPIKWGTAGTTVVMMSTSTLGVNLVRDIDVYNYKTGTWQAPIVSPSVPISDYTLVTALDDSLIIVSEADIVAYNTTTGNWSTVFASNPLSGEADVDYQRSAFVYDGQVYLSKANIALTKFSAEWTQIVTSVAESSVQPKQVILNGEEVIISSAGSGDVSLTFFVYYLITDTWQSFLLPSERTDLTTALSGPFLMALSTNSESFDYCYLPTRTWGTAPLNNYFSPAAAKTITYNSTNIIVLAGGIDREFGFYSDSVLMLNIDALEIPIEPVSAPLADVIAPFADPAASIDSGMLTVAIVVPIVVVLVAAALIVFFLVRRRNRRKKQVTTVGLQGRFGQWYTPFEELKFGAQLGQGANGQVFKGTWKSATVALKVSMTQANDAVIRELELMIKLRPHPNVVQLLGFSIHPETDSVILVLEFCDGGSLDSVLFDDNRVIDMPQKIEWLVGISQGLSHLHSNHIVHRDVAARNVLLHRDAVKVTDFGMSRLVEDNQRGTTKSELGPIRWMAPESLKSKEYSTKSDAWSFGILMYEVIAQQEPHAKEDPIEIGRLIRDQGVTPPIPTSCPSQVAALMQSCWHVSPALRPDFESITQQLEGVTF